MDDKYVEELNCTINNNVITLELSRFINNTPVGAS